MSALTYASLEMMGVKRNTYISEVKYIISFKPDNKAMKSTSLISPLRLKGVT